MKIKKSTFGIKVSFAIVMFIFCGILHAADAAKQVESNKAEKQAYQMGEWTEDQFLAFQTAKDLKLPVLMDFTGSDWCPWCVKLDKEIFSQKDFLDYAKKHFILLKLDFPNEKEQSAELKKQNTALSKKYKINGFPTIIVADADGKVLFRTGYRPGGAKKYIVHLEAMMEEAADQETKTKQ